MALVPLPNAAIEIGGGVAIARAAWLQGYPPAIRIAGAVARPGEVAIDGQDATAGPAGSWTAVGWDGVGAHRVTYQGLSRSYEIRAAPKEWEGWAAHTRESLVLCGAQVAGEAGCSVFASDAGPMWLIGPAPGQIVATSTTAATPIDIASVPFEPVWALPHYHRRSAHRQPTTLIGASAPPQRHPAGATERTILLWCRAIRAAAPPVQQLAFPTEARNLWKQYQRAARSHLKRLR